MPGSPTTLREAQAAVAVLGAALLIPREQQPTTKPALEIMDALSLRSVLLRHKGGDVAVRRCEARGGPQQRGCLLDGTLAARINSALEPAKRSERLAATLSLLTKVRKIR